MEFIAKEPVGSAWNALRESRCRIAIEDGRNISYVWPKEEVSKYLQHRSTGISLAYLDGISVGMRPNGTPFSYTILRGDAQAISRGFELNEYGLKACRIRQRDPKSGKITTLFDDGTLTEAE